MVDAALAGAESAQRAIFDQFGDRVFRLAFRMTGDIGFAEDLTQDVFVRAFDRLHQFRREARFGTWLHAIAASVILNALRKRRTTVARELSIDEGRAVASVPRGVEPDVRDGIIRALGALPVEDRLLVVMHDVEGYGHEEIADALGISAGASRMRLSRVRGALRAALAAHREDLNT